MQNGEVLSQHSETVRLSLCLTLLIVPCKCNAGMRKVAGSILTSDRFQFCTLFFSEFFRNYFCSLISVQII